MDNKTAKELISLALASMRHAYAPYSDFFVGAALLAESGRIFCGFNIENAAFTPTLCAERAAFAKALTEGEKNFCAIAVCGGKHGNASGQLTPPCGVCRQFMREFCASDFPVIVAKSEEEYKVFKLCELLPQSFGPEYLNTKQEDKGRE